jgi:hypothetical protein
MQQPYLHMPEKMVIPINMNPAISLSATLLSTQGLMEARDDDRECSMHVCLLSSVIASTFTDACVQGGNCAAAKLKCGMCSSAVLDGDVPLLICQQIKASLVIAVE